MPDVKQVLEGLTRCDHPDAVTLKLSIQCKSARWELFKSRRDLINHLETTLAHENNVLAAQHTPEDVREILTSGRRFASIKVCQISSFAAKCINDMAKVANVEKTKVEAILTAVLSEIRSKVHTFVSDGQQRCLEDIIDILKEEAALPDPGSLVTLTSLLIPLGLDDFKNEQRHLTTLTEENTNTVGQSTLSPLVYQERIGGIDGRDEMGTAGQQGQLVDEPKEGCGETGWISCSCPIGDEMMRWKYCKEMRAKGHELRESNASGRWWYERESRRVSIC